MSLPARMAGRGTACLAGSLLCAGALLVGASASAPAQQSPDLRYGITKSKDTVTVGERFEIRVRVRAPAAADVRFPENPDTSGAVQGRDPSTIQVLDSVAALDMVATYHVAAWDVGHQAVRFDNVIVTLEGVERRVPLDGVEIFVRSVLPSDSTLRVPKPPRPIFATRPFPLWLLALLAAAVAAGLLLWWWLRRRRRPAVPAVVDPYERARHELARVEAMGLVEAGERTRFAALVVEVLRDFLAARFADASLALTSRELVVLLRRHPSVPLEQLSRLLHEADLAKFAAWTLSEDSARALSREARSIIEREHQASQPPTEVAA